LSPSPQLANDDSRTGDDPDEAESDGAGGDGDGEEVSKLDDGEPVKSAANDVWERKVKLVGGGGAVEAEEGAAGRADSEAARANGGPAPTEAEPP
jgi:hypothetical protein